MFRCGGVSRAPAEHGGRPTVSMIRCARSAERCFEPARPRCRRWQRFEENRANEADLRYAADMWEWLAERKTLLGWLFVLSLASLALTAVVLPIVVVRLPENYFVDGGDQPRGSMTWGGLVWRVLKNLLGVVFVLAGVACSCSQDRAC